MGVIRWKNKAENSIVNQEDVADVVVLRQAART